MSPEAGSRVSHYRLARRLGRGGMGEVFLAEDDRLDRQVAIKFLIGPADDNARRRLMQEARAAAALDHPAICAIHEIGSDPVHGDFIVMQLVEGEPLSTRLHRGRLAPDEALTLCARIAEGLAVAHTRGIVHRDLKPNNVMITPAGDPKLLDFGLAKRFATSPAAADAQTVSDLTQPHGVMGTPGYMSPEQVRSQATDARSDLFALGCLLFECLTGVRAFDGNTGADIAAAVLNVDPPPVSSLRSDLNAAHDLIVSRLLKKEPGERFQSAAEALGSIRALLPAPRHSGTGPPAPIAKTPPPVRRRLIWAGAAVMAIAVTALATFGWPWRAGLPTPPADAAVWYARGVDALREGTYATARSSLEEAIRLFPDYAQAYFRLAQAHAELDDESSAQSALLRASALVPDVSRLPRDDRLRLGAVRAFVLRETGTAIDAYRQLAERHPSDAAGWLDLGRAEEAASRLPAAAASYEKALAIDRQYAAAHMRLGWVKAVVGQIAAAMAAFDEGTRLFQAAGHAEGEAEARITKAIVLTRLGEYRQSRAAVDRVLQLAGDPKFVHQRTRARFQLARLTAVDGKFSDAEAIGNETVREATDARLSSVAASGLVDMGFTMMLMQQPAVADAYLQRAIDLAGNGRARFAEARARLQQASLRLQTGQNEEAIRLSEAPLRFMSEKRYTRTEADGKNILARAHENLEHYDEAARLTADVLKLAESIDDKSLVAATLENLAGQLTKQGRLPEALEQRERIEKIHRDQNDHAFLAFDVPNRAELLMLLGRTDEARPLLDEVAAQLAAGVEAYRGRRRRVALLGALVNTIDGRFDEVSALSAEAMRLDSPPKPPPPGAKPPGPDATTLMAMVLDEYARSQLGRSRAPASTIQQWPQLATSPVTRREVSYWAARTLLARNEGAAAHALALSAWSEAGAKTNAELRWRLAAAAGAAARGLALTPNSASMLAHSATDRQTLEASWRTHAERYFARPDFAPLRKSP